MEDFVRTVDGAFDLDQIEVRLFLQPCAAPRFVVAMIDCA